MPKKNTRASQLIIPATVARAQVIFWLRTQRKVAPIDANVVDPRTIRYPALSTTNPSATSSDSRRRPAFDPVDQLGHGHG